MTGEAVLQTAGIRLFFGLERAGLENRRGADMADFHQIDQLFESEGNRDLFCFGKFRESADKGILEKRRCCGH